MKKGSERNQSPTLRQMEAAKLVLENAAGGLKKDKRTILKEAGYTVMTSETNTDSVFNSEGFKNAIKELTAALNIDKDSRLLKLAHIFWSSGSRETLEANKEIAKMLGDYAPLQQEVKDFRKDRENLIKPE